MLEIVEMTPDITVLISFLDEMAFIDMITQIIPNMFVELCENGCAANPNVNVYMGINVRDATRIYRALEFFPMTLCAIERHVTVNTNENNAVVIINGILPSSLNI
ncbi:hypothetical protein DWS23_05900 [Escherichia coli]|nr:hypothetical protein [Escherichia coli]